VKRNIIVEELPDKTSSELTIIKAGTSEVFVKGPKTDSMQVEQNAQHEKEFNTNLAKAIDLSLKDTTNPFNMLIVAFRKIFTTHFEAGIREFKAEFYNEYDENFDKTKLEPFFVPKPLKLKCKKTQEALSSLQKFIRLILDCLADMYNVVLDFNRLNALKEQLINSLIEIIIDKEVYTVIFMFLRMENKAEEARIEYHINKLKGVTPEQLNVSPFLCLNKCTWNDKVLNHIQNKENGNWKETLKRRIEENKNPYKKAIEKLKESRSFDTPMSKLSAITTLNPAICECINSFWKEIPINKEKLLIDADQYLAILVYIVIKAEAKDLFTHISLANEFATLASTSSYNAYCLTTLQASFYHLMNLNIDDLIKNDS